MRASTVSIASWSMWRRASSRAVSVARDTRAAAGSECSPWSCLGIMRLSAAQAGSRTKPGWVRTGTRAPCGGAIPCWGGLQPVPRTGCAPPKYQHHPRCGSLDLQEQVRQRPAPSLHPVTEASPRPRTGPPDLLRITHLGSDPRAPADLTKGTEAPSPEAWGRVRPRWDDHRGRTACLFCGPWTAPYLNAGRTP